MLSSKPRTPTSLSINRGLLLEEIRSLSASKQKPQTHEPYFSSTDRTQTSLLRFPREIRTLVYRNLLYYGQVSPRVIPSESILVIPYNKRYRTADGAIQEYLRHGLSPSILQCSRMIYEEACEVLYGENCFDVARSEKSGARSWRLTKRNLQHISRVRLATWRNVSENVDGLTLAAVGSAFPRLRHLQLDISMTAAQWAQFVEQSASVLSGVRQGAVTISVASEDERTVYALRAQNHDRGNKYNKEKFCVGLYEPVAKKYLGDKGLRWRYEEDADDMGWYMIVSLFWGGA